MKKPINSLLFFACLCCVTSCGNDLDPMSDGNYRYQREKEKPMVKTIRMHFGGDVITESEEPLFRAEGDGEAYAAINVWRYKKDVENPNKEWYAYGLFKSDEDFDITEDINIDVVTGYYYCFEATILIEREDKVWVNSSVANAYQQPFRLVDISSQGFDSPTGYSVNNLKNEFIYTWDNTSETQKKFFCELASGTAQVDTEVGGVNDRYAARSFPRVKRFYGETPEDSKFDPAALDKVEISLGYKCFGLVIKIGSLPGGTVTVADVTTKNENAKDTKEKLLLDGISLSTVGQEWEGLFSLNDLEADQETFNLLFTWNKGGGVTETFPSGDIIVHPKKRKILTLNITGEINSETKGNLVLNNETDELMNEEEQAISNQSSQD